MTAILALAAPFGYPQGIGISLRAKTPLHDRLCIARLLSEYGCYPKTALRAADAIIASGRYDARLMEGLITQSGHSLQTQLAALGITLEIEEKPPANYENPALWFRATTAVKNKTARNKQKVPRDVSLLIDALLAA
jgi:hypothetical protein